MPMPHHTSAALLISGIGIIPTSILAVGVFAQMASGGDVDFWTNLGAVGALIAMMAFLLTKLLPQINNENNQTIRHLSDNQKQMLENQRRDFIALIQREASPDVDPVTLTPTHPNQGNHNG